MSPATRLNRFLGFFVHPLRPALAGLAALMAAATLLLASAPAQAGAERLVAFGGSGNALLFDAATGSGGWVGSLEEVPEPGVAEPLSLVSVAFFEFDALAQTLVGHFEFTTAAGLGSMLFGRFTGRTLDADPFGSGGQFEIDYLITGGSGRFEGFGGFGLSFLNLDPAATPDNYSETGLLVLAVPLPGTLALAALALALALLQVPARRGRTPFALR